MKNVSDEDKVVCPRCGEDWLLRVQLVRLDRVAVICPECDALWPDGKPRFPGFEEYFAFMKDHGVVEPETPTEIEVIGFFSYSRESDVTDWEMLVTLLRLDDPLLDKIDSVLNKGSILSTAETKRLIDAAFAHSDSWVRQRASHALQSLGREGIPGMIETLHSNEDEIRYRALRWLGDMRNDALPVIPVLFEIVSQASGRILGRAVQAAYLIDATSIERIFELINSKPNREREMCVSYLRSVGWDQNS